MMKLSYLSNGKLKSNECNAEFDFSADLCVVGLGTAGAIAALAGAKYGLNTIGVERCKKIGGIPVNGGVFDYYYGSKNGLFTEINNECYKLEENGYMTSETDRRIEDSVSPTAKNYVLNQVADKNKCNIFVDTDVCGVYSEGRKIIGIKCIRDQKVINIKSKIFMDCSSSAVLSRCFGCKMISGREYDGQKMRYSKAVGVATDSIMKDFSNGWWHHDFTHMPDKTDYMRIKGSWSIYDLPHLSSPKEYSDNLLECSAAEPCIKEKFDKPLYYIGCVPSERESYHVVTDRVLTLKDILSKDKFTKPLFYTFAPLDCTNADVGFESFMMMDWKSCITDIGFSLGIEKEVLIANDADNLLVAGKILGADHSISGGVRMKADVEKSGEAAAAIAYCALSDNCSIRQANYEKLIKVLSKTKCYCPEDNKNLAELRVPLGTERKPYAFPETTEEIKKEFESTTASRALWKAAYMWSDDESKVLHSWINEGSKTFKINCAYVLGVRGSQEGKNILVDFINSKEKIPPEALKNGIYSQYVRALMINARYGWTETIDAVKEILICSGTNIYPKGNMKFRIVITSMCIRILSDIYENHSEMRDDIKAFIKSLPKQDDKTLKFIYSNTPFIK